MKDINYMLDYYQKMNGFYQNQDMANNFSQPIQLDSAKGFIRGNMFDNLYDQYRNYVPSQINSQNDRQSLLEKVMQYNFALTDLNLYLDNYPNDAEVIKIFNNYRNMYLNAVSNFEKSYGPLETVNNPVNTNNWVWNKSPWPWEVQR